MQVVVSCVFRDDGELGGFGWGENGANCKKGAFVPFFTLSPFLGGEQVGFIVKKVPSSFFLLYARIV